MTQPNLTAPQRRQLDNFWRRQKAQVDDRALAIARQFIGQVMKPDGTLKNVASEVGGDLVGIIAAAVVVGLRGKLISTTVPSDGDVLVFDGALQQWVPQAVGSTGGHWEPVVTGPPEDPQFVFSGGDIVMSFVED